MAKILVTGAAGFIGAATARRMIQDGHEVLGLDVMKEGPRLALQERRVAHVQTAGKFQLVRADITDGEAIRALMARAKPDFVIHLAAEVGVRRSVEFPEQYAEVNIRGFLNVLEGCRLAGVKHLIYASSSSVYGSTANLPWTESRATDEPLSLYAATKKANELMAHTYSGLHGFATTGLRFFTAYGPWGRPDMAYYSFAEKIVAGKPIKLFHAGQHARDFTYIDDITEVISRLVKGTPSRPARVFNVGRGIAVGLRELVAALEKGLGKSALIVEVERQPGDVLVSQADMQMLRWDLGYTPPTRFEDGIQRFLAWFSAQPKPAPKPPVQKTKPVAVVAAVKKKKATGKPKPSLNRR